MEVWDTLRRLLHEHDYAWGKKAKNKVFLSKADRREKEALDWVQRIDGDTMSEADMESYVAWMELNEENAIAFRRLDAAWIVAGEATDAIRAQFGPEARALDDGPSLWSRGLSGLRPGWTLQFAALCGALALILVVGLQAPEENTTTMQQFATSVGERRDITLEDGSIVTLNTGSEISIAFEADRRTVNLSRGGALFDVTPDATRPFMVRMDGGAVEVLGTVFDVLRKDEGFSVTVLEGRVSVSADVEGLASNKAVVLAPNQGADVNTRLASLSSFSIDADIATAWRRGQLIYRIAPLGQVMADLNRYATVPLSVEDEAIRELVFTGVLAIESADLMMARLAGLLRLEAVSTEDGGLRLQSVK